MREPAGLHGRAVQSDAPRVQCCFALAEGPAAPSPRTLATRAADGTVSGMKVPVADGDVADFAIVAATTAPAQPAAAAAKGQGRRRSAKTQVAAAASVGLFIVDLQ